jgi:photosystem II stability/assembly factor-like uncharacterized protein
VKLNTKGVRAASVGLVALTILWYAPRMGAPVDGDAVMSASAATAVALTGTWVRTGGPLGGLGYDIRMQPDNPNIMYVTDAFAGVHKSTDGGATWTASDTGIDARTGPSNDAIPVFCLTMDPNNYNTLWVGMTGIRGVYRSTDAGVTWARKDTGIIEDAGLTIRGIGVKPGDSNTVFAAGEVASYVWNGGQQAWGREFDRVQGVIYRSTNAGQSWTLVWRGDNLARYVLFDPTNTNTVYASTGLFDREAKNSDPVANTPGGVGVLKSTDGGATWTALTNGLGNLYIDSLFISPANPQILLAGAANNAYLTGGGIYRTTNGGASWQLAGATQIQAVEFSTGTPATAYAASSSQFYRSTDSGATWTLLNPTGTWGPASIRPGFPIDLQVDPRNAQRIFVNNYGGGNFLSTDGGTTWNAASTGYTGADLTDVAVDPSNAGKVYATGRSGPFKSASAGSTWAGMNPLNVQEIAEGARVAVDPSNSNNILMSSAHWGWTYRSTDGGTNWTLVTNFANELNALSVPDTNQRFQGMQAIAFAPSAPSRVYGGFGVWRCATDVETALCNTATIASIFTSSDSGATWTRHNGVAGNRTVSRIVVDPLNASKAWASTLGGGVFITTDGGTTWTASNSGLTDLNVWALAGTPSNASVLYAGTLASGLFKSTDGGASWSPASIGMAATEPITSVVVSPADANVVYAGSRATGVYVSTNAGGSWTLDSTGLRQRAIQALSLSADGTLLYAATKGEGVFRLGTAPAPCDYTIAPSAKSFAAAADTGTVTVTAAAGCAWTAASNATWLTITAGSSGSGNGTMTYGVAANPASSRSGTLTIAGQTFTVTQSAPSAVSLDRTSLNFTATSTGTSFVSATSAQTVHLTQSGTGVVTWTASSTTPWLVVSPTSGSGSGALTVSTQFASGLVASQTGRINVTATGAANSVGPINVTLTVLSSTAAAALPFGSFDTPAGDATVLAGSVAVTGWTLDNIGVKQVELWRDLQPGETTPPFSGAPTDPRTGRIFIANATFVDGARPDVEGLYPNIPASYRAGWGYLMLTWGLFGQGNGTYKFYAFGVDWEGNTATIGTKTVVISNNAATKPFGSIDTPGIGGDASGPNFGWGLTPKVNGAATCKIQPSGVQYSIDSGPLQPVVYGDARTDIAGAFPGFSNTTTAGGHAIIDWTALTNGPHTIGWLITDDCNRADGVGSRFFNVTTGTSLRSSQTPALNARRTNNRESDAPITVARGYGELPVIVTPGEAGDRIVEMQQGERIEIRLPRGYETAYQLVTGGQPRAVPTGSTWDGASGTFSWQPAPAFLGRYRLVFSNGRERIGVRIVIVP